MRFRCPTCQEPCINVEIGPATMNVKTDPRLVNADRQQVCFMLTAQCVACSKQYTVLLPMISLGVQEIQIAPRARVMSEGEARAAGLHREPN